MSTLQCNACNSENHPSSTKCEHCKARLSVENLSPIEVQLENDWLDIDNAELEGKVVKIEDLNDFDKSSFLIECEPDFHNETQQPIKQEPEFQIESDFVLNNEESINESKRNLNEYQCNTCNKWFKRKSALLSHINFAHGDSDSDTEKPGSRVPNSSFKSKNVPPSIKTINLTNPTEVKQNQSDVSYSCNLCDALFSQKDDLNLHRSKCSSTKGNFFCEPCNLFLSRNSALIKHQQSKQHISNLSCLSNDARKFVCIFCGEIFSQQILLTSHKIQMHKGEESTLLRKTARMERIDGRLKYFCLVCNKLSSNKSAHTEHLRVHKSIKTDYVLLKNKGKPVKCELCGGGFSSRSSLNQHIKLHTDELSHKCHICGATYRHKKSLDKHLIKHSGERPFKCEYCSKTFMLKYTFRDHVRLRHTGEKPYECDECKETFKTSSLLNFHRRNKHNVDTNSKPRVKIFQRRTTSDGGGMEGKAT